MRITDSLTVHVASVAALALLKIVAWRDRRSWTSKDAIDLAHLFEAVESDPYRDEIWADDKAAELVEYDGALLGAAWLGHQASAAAGPDARRAIAEVLDDHFDALAADIPGELARARLEAFARGFAWPSA